MGVEIERKYLVDPVLWNHYPKPAGAFYRQGYLHSQPGLTIRVRQTPDKGFITIKGKTVGISRSEYEYEIPFKEAGEMLDAFASTSLTKYRYTFRFEGHIWEVDVFEGDNKGLIIAEIELSAEEEAFTLPPFITQEVSADARYNNSYLAAHPFKQW